MAMCLQMLQKPPVIFTQYAPSRIISRTELERCIQGSSSDREAVSRLWIRYSHYILAEVDPCMEANEGVTATVSLASRYPVLSRMRVSRMNEGCFEMTNGNARLYLCERDAGEVFLYFFPPDRYCNGPDECRIDLTDFGSDASAYFIATVFDSYERITDYYNANVHA